ncbi:MAG: sigma-54 interaction domain-containing protein [Thermacetogeniaceae bacterium]|jgi:arginine utilization regulatory protein
MHGRGRLAAEGGSDIRGLPLEDVFPWLDLKEEQIEKIEVNDNKNRILTLKGKIKKHHINGKHYTSIILTDITELTKLKAKYKQTNCIKQKYEQALESLFEGVIITDSEGKIIYVNKAQEELDNVTKDDVYNKKATEVFNLDNESSVLMQALITKKEVPERHQYYINMVGHAVNIVTYGYPLTVNGKVVGAVAICRDTTKAKELAEMVLDYYDTRSNGQIIKPSAEKAKTRDNLYTFKDLIGNNAAFKEAIRWAQVSAETDSSVLIYGLTGTGKELFAQSVHSHSNRKNGPFIGINCAALPESLLESILFGTVKGAFTGAIDRPGLFEQANGGTLFLDELNSMPLGLQAKLLRVLQDGTIRRVGGTQDISVDVRIISSLNTDPNEAVNKKVLRQDLFYRLAVVSIRIPPLKERRDDIPMLTSFFIGKHNRKLKKSVKDISPEVMQCFLNYHWPGNVRELEHVIECAMVVIGDGSYITLDHLPHHLIECYAQQQDEHDEVNQLVILDADFRKQTHHNNRKKTNYILKHKIDSTERDLIVKILSETQGNVSRTARILGISRQSLQYRLKKYNINRANLVPTT